MTTASHPFFWNLWSEADRHRTTSHAPRPAQQPVFIHDAITPWGPDTMLLSLLRAAAQKDGNDQP